METKAMLPDSTQSETLPSGTSSAAHRPPSTRSDSLGSNSKARKSDGSKKKKRKSEEKTAKSGKKKKGGRDKSHKEQKSSKKSKKSNEAAKTAEVVEQDSDLDLENELKPIRDYILNREEMLQHMLKCVTKANKLQAMLPDVLKDVKMEELQQLCLLQLEGMSKSRVMSILAGDEMQSSSDEEESDLEAEKDRSKREEAEDNLINSEVVDSTSSLPQASISVADVDEVMSVYGSEEETAGEEAKFGDGIDAQDIAEGEGDEEDVASPDNSWQDRSERHPRYSDEDEDMDEDDEEEEEDDIRHRGESDVDSAGEEDREEELEEQTLMQKPKKLCRIKIVRAEGEECEEGEITSDEVETDQESVDSSPEDDEDVPGTVVDTEDATPLDTHPGGDTGEREASKDPGESVGGLPGDVKRSRLNSGNHGDDDDNNDNASVDEDTSAHVHMNVSVTENLVNDGHNVGNGATVNTTVNTTVITAPVVTADVVTVGATVSNDIVDNSLNIFAEDEPEIDTEDNTCNSDKDRLVQDGNSEVDSNGLSDNADEEKCSDGNDRESVNCASTSGDVETVERKARTAQAVGQTQGATGTAKSSGRKVAQELEVLELELRARAIRSLMKQYRKDLG